MNPQLHRVIGIDLGTTYSAVAAFNTYMDRADTILNAATGDGETTASVVSVDPLTRKAVVGAWAKRNRPADPESTVIEIKREMGEEFTHESLEKFNARGVNQPELAINQPVRAFFAGNWLLPQEISAFILMRMKQVAEQEIGEEIRDAVITVPAYFKEKQKRATREAALLAGLYPLQLIPEPTAAAICYGVDRGDLGKKVYLVYDLGGGTFDVSIIEVEGNTINVIATSGDPRLGGGDFDDAIVNWSFDELARRYQIDLRNQLGEAAMRIKADIKLQAERAKIILSREPETTLSFLTLDPTKAPTLQLTRAKFEELIHARLQQSLRFVELALEAAKGKGVPREQLTAILLVGGSSKIPRVKTMLLEYFQKSEEFVRSDADPDLVVARGAAILAHRFLPSTPPFDIRRPADSTNVNTSTDDTLIVRHITEHSLGVAVQGGRMSRIIEQGTNIPAEVMRDNFTNAGPTTDIEVHVFQGEGQYIQDCTEIGMVHLGPIEPLPEGRHRFEVSFALDMSGLLTATVHQQNTGKRWTAKFEHKTGVGGVDALAAMRNRLLNLFAGTVSAPPPMELRDVPPQSVPPPVTVRVADMSATVTAIAAGQAWTYPPAAAAPSEPPPDSSPAPATRTASASHAAPPSEPAAVAVAAPPVSEVAKPSQPPTDLVEPTRDPPPTHASLVRRAYKRLLKQSHPALARAYNEYVTALNSGAEGDDLDDLGEDLKDVYDRVLQTTA